MAKFSKRDTPISDVHPDAWSRFERAVDVVAKSPPQHRSKKKSKIKKSAKRTNKKQKKE
jgi:hypothetical protein